MFYCDVFLLGLWMCTQSVILWVFRYGHWKYAFVSQWTKWCWHYLVNISATVLTGWVLHGSSLIASLRSAAWRFLCINISQDSVATSVRCGGIFNYFLARNLLLSLLVKEFWKSASIWLRSSQTFPKVHASTKRCCSFIQYGLNCYQHKIN